MSIADISHGKLQSREWREPKIRNSRVSKHQTDTHPAFDDVGLRFVGQLADTAFVFSDLKREKALEKKVLLQQFVLKVQGIGQRFTFVDEFTETVRIGFSFEFYFFVDQRKLRL